MKKAACVFMFLFLFGLSDVFAETMWRRETVFSNNLVAAQGATAETISQTIIVSSGKRFGFWCTANSVMGLPSIRIVYEQAADSSDKTWATPPTGGLITATLITESPIVIDITPTTVKFIRFKAISNGLYTNSTDTTVTAYLFIQD